MRATRTQLVVDDHLGREKEIGRWLWAIQDARRRTMREIGLLTPEYVLHHLMQHEAEHRGQIGALRTAAGRALAKG